MLIEWSRTRLGFSSVFSHPLKLKLNLTEFLLFILWKWQAMLNQSWLFSLPVFSLLTTAICQSQELYSHTLSLSLPFLSYLNLQTFLAFLILSQLSYPGSHSPRAFLYDQRKSEDLSSVVNPFILTRTFNAYTQMNEKCFKGWFLDSLSLASVK